MTTNKLEFPVCALCGSDSRHVVHAGVQDFLCGVPGQFTVVRCTNCELVYLYPRPALETLGDYYPAHYAPFVEQKNTSQSKTYTVLRNIAHFPYRVFFGDPTSALPPFGQQRMLDVGCGAGEYLQDMQQLGWDVHGVDLSAHAVRAAGELVGASKVWAGTLETLDPSLKELDLITMNHCLEHVPDPRATLEEAYRRLAINGKIKIRVPDASGFGAKIFGRYWLGWDVPRHLYDFSGQTLGKLLQQCGFCIVSSRPQYFPWLTCTSFDRAMVLGMHLRSRRIRQSIRGFVFLIALISYPFGNRGAVEMVARKVA